MYLYFMQKSFWIEDNLLKIKEVSMNGIYRGFYYYQ